MSVLVTFAGLPKENNYILNKIINSDNLEIVKTFIIGDLSRAYNLSGPSMMNNLLNKLYSLQ